MTEKVLNYFQTLTQIPRESGNEKGVALFLEDFALKNNLFYHVDEFNNVLIKKKTCDKKPLIIASHTDMVCVSEKDFKFNFKTQHIQTFTEMGFIKAKGTSLGADNGIGVAMALALLTEDFDMNIEAVFTSEEETTMNGTLNFNTLLLEGKHMLSLDGSEESCIDTSSASSTIYEIKFDNMEKQQIKDNVFCLSVSGFKGGHSGVDIGKNHGNPINVALAFFKELNYNIKLVEWSLETKSNEIPTFTQVVFETQKTKDEIEKVLQTVFNKEGKIFDVPQLKMQVQRVNLPKESFCLTNEFSECFLNLLDSLKFGVFERKDDNVISSSNVYEIKAEFGIIRLHSRANGQKCFSNFLKHLENLKNKFNFMLSQISHLPGFKNNQNSSLLKLLQKTHYNLFNTHAKLQNIHAGVECAIFSQKIKNLDVLVIGATINNMHSTKEEVKISSIHKTYAWLCEIVKNFK